MMLFGKTVSYLRFVLLSLVLFATNAQSAATPQVVTLATTQWCPYACDNNELGKGIVHDYLSMILKPKGIAVELLFLPWAEAVEAARNGKADGLLTVIESEAPDMVFTSTPSMHYKMCFYTDKADTWQYTGVQSLSKRQLGIIAGYGYGEPVDSYIQMHNQSDKVQVFQGDNSLPRLLNLLSSSRVDTFIEEAYVVRWQNRTLGTDTYRQAGCMKPVPFFTGFNPKFAQTTGIVTILNHALMDLKYQSYLNQYLLPYYFSPNSSNWRDK